MLEWGAEWLGGGSDDPKNLKYCIFHHYNAEFEDLQLFHN